MKRSAQNFFLLFLSFTLLFLIAFLTFSPKPVPYGELAEVAADIEKETGEVDLGKTEGFFEGKSLQIPKELLSPLNFVTRPKVLGEATGEKWIEVDLSEQKLRAWQGNSLYLETLISSGLPWWPTPQGEFRIWYKIRATRMRGGSGRHAYDLPNVPFVMFFENGQVPGYRGYGLHGTYWHNDFGRPKSHGCVNLPTKIAEQLYYWTTPVMPDGKRVIRSTLENPGTRIVIHE